MGGMAPDENTGPFGAMGEGGGEEQGDVRVKHGGQFEGLRLIPNPPDLDCWRQKLFNVDDILVLNEEQYVKQPFIPTICARREMEPGATFPETTC
jgi:hypothetical protein